MATNWTGSSWSRLILGSDRRPKRISHLPSFVQEIIIRCFAFVDVTPGLQYVTLT
ncbi:hypothetical protein MK139_06980 [bacterium]|nr:hypothetical protein [bacterium]